MKHIIRREDGKFMASNNEGMKKRFVDDMQLATVVTKKRGREIIAGREKVGLAPVELVRVTTHTTLRIY